MITLKKLDNGFEYIEITNKVASAKIALQGAHLFRYKTDVEHLWVSSIAKFEKGKAIRGGVPICWPQFGKPKDSKLKQHGFARESMFELVESKDSDAMTIVTLKLIDAKDENFNYGCELSITFYIGEELKIELTTKNLDTKQIKITQALHTYFAISHISNISIRGLENKPYLDQLDAKFKKDSDAIAIVEEVDRIYQDVDSPIILEDADKTINITNTNSASTIVWNPWIEKAKNTKDMDDDGYENFVCIESANALDDFVVLEGGESYILTTKQSFY
ncbi:MAG: D-hexose-6-phosphate mutarotase [Campylobacterota bacterium]|nr:D-hexose-6-phosphate mutarotase [Campylobacterota bacterium]